jgi:hypothetical protein
LRIEYGIEWCLMLCALIIRPIILYIYYMNNQPVYMSAE